eukprot:761937-Hanusia_phi.AAC.2
MEVKTTHSTIFESCAALELEDKFVLKTRRFSSLDAVARAYRGREGNRSHCSFMSVQCVAQMSFSKIPNLVGQQSRAEHVIPGRVNANAVDAVFVPGIMLQQPVEKAVSTAALNPRRRQGKPVSSMLNKNLLIHADVPDVDCAISAARNYTEPVWMERHVIYRTVMTCQSQHGSREIRPSVVIQGLHAISL